jgi:hypothetical protein
MASWRFLLFFVDPNRFYRIGWMNRHHFSTFNYGWDSLPAWAAAGQFHYSWPRSNELLDLPIIDY